jgi:hypothetical protein
MYDRLVSDEREQLLRMAADQRQAVRNALLGLTEEQARATPSASALSLAVVLKHLVQGEERAIGGRVAGRSPEGDPVAEWQSGFFLGPGDSVAALLARWNDVARQTEEVIRAEPTLDRVVPVSEEVRRWLAPGVLITVRWMVLHLIEESARHAGHADVIRESIDGKRARALAARAAAPG